MERLQVRSPFGRWLVFLSVVVLCLSRIATAKDQEPLQQLKKPAYKAGQAIPVSCLKRTIESGEHMEDDRGQLQYIPFPTCNETGRPLEFNFGVEKETNCTISFISDEFFHLLEFYVHNDAPLTCRLPARPLDEGERQVSSVAESSSEDYVPIIFALSGQLQQSHIHISHNLNVLLHAAPRSVAPGVVDSAIAYSTSSTTRNTRIVIGDALPFRLSIRWYPSTNLPSGWTGVGGHLYVSTLVYCLLCIFGTAAAALAYFRGVEFPRKLRRYGADRLSGDSGAGSSRLGGYGYGLSNGYGYGISARGGTGSGKMD